MEYFKKNWPFFLGLLLSLSLLWPLFASPSYSYHDDVTFIRLYEMDKCFKDGQIPCRWVPDLGNLYGYPLFNYYAPLPYYFGEIIYSLSQNLIFSVKFMFAFSFICSYIFMFLLARKFWGNVGGAFSGIFYSFAPYHAVDFYIRGAMGEMWGLMFFPAIFWAFTKLEEKPSIHNLLLSAFFVTGLITAHNLSAFIFFIPLVFWFLFLYLRRRSKQFVYFSIGVVLIGLGLSSFYLLPATFEKDLVHVDSTTIGYFSYTEHFKGFKKLFGNYWGYGGSFREFPGSEKDGLPYQIGWVHLLGLLLSLYTAWGSRNKKRWVSGVIIFSTLTILASVFMINPRSDFLWKAIDPLKYLQFPWRFLMLVIFFISFIAGSIVSIPFRYKKYTLGLVVILVVLLNFTHFKPEKFIQINDKDLLSGRNWEWSINRAIFDFLPIYSKEPPGKLATERYQILTGDTTITNFKEGTNWLNFIADTKSHSIVRLSQYYFPDWKIFIDGKEARVDYKNNSLGLMTIILGVGPHTIEGRLYDTPVRSAANMISVLAFILSMILFATSFKRVRSLIAYYRKRVN